MPHQKIKFIYWFAYHDLFASSVRYRAKYPLDFAREQLGINSYLVLPGYSPKRLLIFLKAYFSALFFRKPGSIIVIQRVQSDFIYATLLKFLVLIRKKNSVYDLDDADYLQNKPDTIIYFARKCESVSAGSEAIASYLGNFNPRIFHVSSAIYDLNIVKKKRNPVFTVGWIGAYGFGHKDSLQQLVFPALQQLPFSFRLVLLGVTKKEDVQEIESYFHSCNNIVLEIPAGLDWNNEIELQDRIATFDIGIATLLEHPLQIAKSGIKAKQYMNNGVPVLCNNLPENNKVVINGINGYLCDTPGEFTKRLIEFESMTDEEYAGFSVNARKTISNFNYFKYFNDFEQIIAQSPNRQIAKSSNRPIAKSSNRQIIQCLLLLLLSPLLLFSQPQWPVKLAVSNEATAIPYTRLFTAPVHPCVQLGTEYQYKNGEHHELYQTANLGYIFHNYLYQGVYLNTGIGYDYKFGFGLKLKGMFELGYLHTFSTQDEYQFKEGEYVNGADWGNARLMPMLSVGVGYLLVKEDPASPEIFLLYKSWIEYPYSPGFIQMMSHINLEIGCKIYLFGNHEK